MATSGSAAVDCLRLGRSFSALLELEVDHVDLPRALVARVEAELLSVGPPETEDYCLFLYNEQAFNRAKRQHHEYWDWWRNRNESRWTAQERGQMDYDAKNMMHLVRLLLSGENIVKTGEPIVRFGGERLETLLSIRRGE